MTGINSTVHHCKAIPAERALNVDDIQFLFRLETNVPISWQRQRCVSRACSLIDLPRGLYYSHNQLHIIQYNNQWIGTLCRLSEIDSDMVILTRAMLNTEIPSAVWFSIRGEGSDCEAFETLKRSRETRTCRGWRPGNCRDRSGPCRWFSLWLLCFTLVPVYLLWHKTGKMQHWFLKSIIRHWISRSIAPQIKGILLKMSCTSDRWP